MCTSSLYDRWMLDEWTNIVKVTTNTRTIPLKLLLNMPDIYLVFNHLWRNVKGCPVRFRHRQPSPWAYNHGGFGSRVKLLPKHVMRAKWLDGFLAYVVFSVMVYTKDTSPLIKRMLIAAALTWAAQTVCDWDRERVQRKCDLLVGLWDFTFYIEEYLNHNKRSVVVNISVHHSFMYEIFGYNPRLGTVKFNIKSYAFSRVSWQNSLIVFNRHFAAWQCNVSANFNHNQHTNCDFGSWQIISNCFYHFTSQPHNIDVLCSVRKNDRRRDSINVWRWTHQPSEVNLWS